MFSFQLFGLLIGFLLMITVSPTAGAKVRSDSIVFIECTGADGKTSIGSGVIVSGQGLILTAKHVAPDGHQCRGVIGTGATTPIRKLIRRRTSSIYDAMLLTFLPDQGEVFHPVRYVKITPDMSTWPVTAMGFPIGGTGQVSSRSGVISTTFPDERGFIETDALTARQMSGGPVFLDENDGLIGLIVGADFDKGTGQPTNYSVLAAELIATELGLDAAGKFGGTKKPACDLTMKLEEYLQCANSN